MKLKNLRTDFHPLDQPEGTYRYAKNAVLTNTLGAIENEKGFFKHASVIPGTNIVGIIPMGMEFLIFSVHTGTDTSYIGVGKFLSGVLQYEAVIVSEELGFSPSYAIKGEYQVNAKGERIAAWIELGKIVPPRIINVDNPEVSTINDLSLFPTYTTPSIGVSVLQTGGALLTARYIPIAKYRNLDGTETNWGVGLIPASVINESSSETFTQRDGAPAGTPSTKALQLTFTGVDQSYDQLVVGYIQIKGGVSQAFKIGEIDAVEGATFIITGNEEVIDVSFDDVTTPLSAYTSAQAITQLDNTLVLANLTTSGVLNLQPIANKIRVRYTVAKQFFSNYKGETFEKSFQSGEVYALYFVVELTNGTSLAFHIPGRAMSVGEKATDSTTIPGVTAKVFQINDTSLAVGDTSLTSNMAGWENASERYPADFPNGEDQFGVEQALANQPVRHHKFPDLETLRSREYVGQTAFGVSFLPRLGISVSNVVIPEEYKSQITSWRIAYAKRSYENSLIVGSDHLHLAGAPTRDDLAGLIWSTGGNWNIKAIAGDGDASWNDTRIWAHSDDHPVITKVQRGHCPDILYDRPGVVPSYVHLQYKLQTGGLYTPYTGFGSPGGHMYRSGEGAGQRPGVVIDYTRPYDGQSSLFSTPLGKSKRRISNFQYIPQNSQVNNIMTKNQEEIIYMEIDELKPLLESHGTSGIFDVPTDYGTELDLPMAQTRSSGADRQRYFSYAQSPFIAQNGYDRESTCYLTYKQILSDMYSSYKTQTLVTTGRRFGVNTEVTSTIYGGDTNLSFVSVLTIGIQSSANAFEAEATNYGVRAFRHYLSETRHNWNYRHQDTAQIQDLYAPKMDPRDFWTNRDAGQCIIDVATVQVNKLNYNTDYDILNDYLPAVIIDKIEDFSSTAPTTIIWSDTQQADSSTTSWKSFPAANIHVQPRHKGVITNLQGFGNNELLIHHEHSLFITQAKIGLAADAGDINLKSRELFEISPKEILTVDEGYAGTKHSLACRMTKLGYAFVDDSTGKVFTFNGQLQEISANGMRAFFRDTARSVTNNNPFNSIGYTIVFDESLNRLIFTKKKDNQSFTISYSSPMWISYHDYIPDYGFNLSNGMTLLVKDVDIYEMNAGDRGKYFDETPYAFFVDASFAEANKNDKVLENVRWVNFISQESVLVPNKTLTALTIFSPTQCTGRIPLTPITGINRFLRQNTRQYNQTWEFNNIYSIAISPDFLLPFYDGYEIDPTKLNSNLPWYAKEKVINKFVTCRFEYDNADNAEVILTEVDAEFRESPR